MVPSVFVEQRNDGFDVSFLNDVQSFWTFHQDAMKDFQDSFDPKQKPP